ncbi:MAG: arsenic resistance N-acetyltransferase ArsN2 [Gemmatimonadales bacterium]
MSPVTVTLRPPQPADYASVITLIEEAGLPTAGITEDLDGFMIAVAGNDVIGAAGLERYGTDGLLRSVVVTPSLRSTGVGGALVESLLGMARRAGLKEVYLLTETAEAYFPRHGFAPVPRGEVPESVKGSVEFQGACSESAMVMHRSLAPRRSGSGRRSV